MLVRLDKYLANLGIVTRRDASDYLKHNKICLNGVQILKSDTKISDGDVLCFPDFELEVKDKVYLLLNKKAGYVSSDIDEGTHLSYKHLLDKCPYKNLLSTVGRLDQDTEGLLLITNDGDFIHKIISPKSKCEKEYHVDLEDPIDDISIEKLKGGVVLDDGYKTLPAIVERLTDKSLKIIIYEGKYHQIKRMLESVGNKVIYLRRDRIANWTTDGISLGEWKYIEI